MSGIGKSKPKRKRNATSDYNENSQPTRKKSDVTRPESIQRRVLEDVTNQTSTKGIQCHADSKMHMQSSGGK